MRQCLAALMTLLASPALAASGGPDAFGNTWIDSASPGGPTYNWLTPAAPTVLPASGDEGFATFTSPFPITLYNTSFTSLTVSTNGYLTPGNANWTYVGTCLSGRSEITIAPFADDLLAGAAAQITWGVVGSAPNRILVVTWWDVGSYYDYTQTNPFRFQVQFSESAETIEFHYQDITGASSTYTGGASATVGLGLDTTTYLERSCNSAVLTTHMAIRWEQCLTDLDGDGAPSAACGGIDCNDNSATIYPGAPELCDALDNDCDPATSETVDDDGDGQSECGGDCDDGNGLRRTGLAESCDGFDNNCDLVVPPTESDADGDFFRICQGDCDDTSATVYPFAPEVCDGADSDCVGGLPADEVDSDGDSSPNCEDCADLDPSIHPGATESCDGVDQDCQGLGETWETPTSDSYNPFAGLFRGAFIQPSENALLTGTQMYLSVDVGSSFTWVVYEASSESGPFTQVWTGPGTANGTATQWYSAPPLNVELLAGNTYVIGIVWDTLTTISYWWVTTTGAPIPMAHGEYLAGAQGNYPLATTTSAFNTIQNFYGQRFSFGGEADVDADGWLSCEECDDSRDTVFPGAAEICDGFDTNCDGLVPPSEDNDDADPVLLCEGDCDDNDATIYPGAPEGCDAIDNDCDGLVPSTTLDSDADGFPECEDCNNNNVAIYPGAPESCDGIDSDCGGSEPEPAWTAPGSTYLLDSGGNRMRGNVFLVDEGTPLSSVGMYLSAPAGTPIALYAYRSTTSATTGFVPVYTTTVVAPVAGAQWVDAPSTSLSLTAGAWYAFFASWGPASVTAYTNFGLTEPTWATFVSGLTNTGTPSSPLTVTTYPYQLMTRLVPLDESDEDADGYAVCESDCDDGDTAVNPGAPEVCDTLDNNCDGLLGPGEIDADGDGVATCAGDCEDADATVYPGAPEICDSQDNDCNPLTPATEQDGDGDGVMNCDGDCNDGNALIYPGAPEACNGSDDNCDTVVPSNENDNDGDGYRPCSGDCNDFAAAAYPGAPEICDALDDDCDGIIPPGEPDADGDGTAACGGDCDDGDATVEPGAPEVCDAQDNNCDGIIPITETDNDGDGSPTCEGDCDDSNPNVYIGAAEACDGLDTNCVGGLLASEVDADVDGAMVCEGDCDDLDAFVYPGATELCNGEDDDCDGAPDADTEGEVDLDGDGARSCADCDDGNPARYPGATELCNGLDDDCDGAPDADAGGEADGDGDGFLSCIDCEDGEAGVHPGAAEVCDGFDTDCTPATDESVDADFDGATICDGDCNDASADQSPDLDETCDGGLDNDCDPATDENGDIDADGMAICEGDCDDGNAATYPGATEICDGEDNDCNRAVPPDEVDGDEDGQFICAGDCDDGNPAIYDGAPEVCDGIDNDCDGTVVDEGEDADGDGISPCDGDCDDTDPAVNPDADEQCNGIDDDCDAELPPNESDADGDGVLACGGDCEDEDASVHPGAAEDTAELCNDNLDNDCDGDEDGAEADCEGLATPDGGQSDARGCNCGETSGSTAVLGLLLIPAIRRRRE